MIFSIDPTLTSDEMIRQLLGFSCGQPIGYNDVSIGLPEQVYTDPGGTNTELKITRKPGSTNIKPGGPQTIIRRYRRLEMGYFCSGLHPEETEYFSSMDPTLENFNRMFHTKFTKADLNIEITYREEGKYRDVKVTVAETHYGFYGSFIFSRNEGDGKVSIIDAYSGEMPGFEGGTYQTPVSIGIFDGVEP
ncbi:hypothetical protein TOTORO_01540 [Serratia phage vB_SmaS-Totoro]|nr:hypothetical protein TOTORO_01540 [Serratia phage vB_SmaS-Totoro]